MRALGSDHGFYVAANNGVVDERSRSGDQGIGARGWLVRRYVQRSGGSRAEVKKQFPVSLRHSPHAIRSSAPASPLRSHADRD
jgi:hypothetical protein